MKKKKNLQDFLLAGRKMHWFPLAISILAAGVSSISMLGTPTYIFRNNLQIAVPNLLLSVPLTIFIGITMVPVFYLMQSYTIYEFLELRFHKYVRTATSIMQILTKLSWVATIIYVPSLVVSTLSGIPVWTSVILIGVIGILFSTFGGYESIVWADMIHFAAVMIGLTSVCLIMFLHFNGNIKSFWEAASLNSNTRFFDFSVNFTEEATFGAVLTSMFISTVSMFGTDQMILQKCFSAKDLKSAVWSMVGNSIIGIPFALLLIFIGLGLAAYFNSDNQLFKALLASDPDPNKALDKAIPFFIMNKMPIGIAGLFVSAILAITISSVNAGISTLATISLKDIAEKYIKAPWQNEEFSMKTSRWLMLGFGIIATIIALYVGKIGTILQIFAILYSFIGSPLFGVFMLGLFTRQANNFGIVCGLIAGYIICPLCYFMWDVNWVWLGTIVTFAVMSVGYISSIIHRFTTKDYNYSIYTWKYRPSN